MEKVNEDWHVFEFNAPIIEHAEVDNEFVIKGIAISETTTHNNHKYIAEELEKAAPSLKGKPLLVDHDNRVESIKGRVSNSYFDHATRSIKFEAKVMDSKVKEMIKDGRINNVSIGAFAQDLVHDEESGSFIAKGIRGAELSLVAVPADENANFAMAFTKNYSLKESLKLTEQQHKCKECDKVFPDEVKLKDHMKSHKKKESVDIYTDERRLSEMTEEMNSNLIKEADSNKQLIQKMGEEISVLKNERHQNFINEYKRLCLDKQVTEKDVSKASEESIKFLIEQIKDLRTPEAKKDMKSVVNEQVPEGLNNFMVERTNAGRFATWAMPDSKGRITFK